MRKIKLSDSEIRLLLLFLAVLMFAGAYFLSFQKNMERAREIEVQNEEDRAFVELLESMVARRDEVEAQTEEYHQIISDIIAKYPSDVPEEKEIEIVQGIEDRTGVSVSSISFSMYNEVVNLASGAWTMNAEDENGTEDEEGVESQTVLAGVPSVGYRNTLGMNYTAEYSDLKEMVDYINGLSDRTTISAISASYDNGTGNISGSITVNMYYLTNTGREYVAPHIIGIGKGVPDIFRSGGGSVTATAAEVEENDEENDEENVEGNEEEQAEDE